MNTKHYYLRLLRTFALAALTAAATAACSDDTDNDREPLTPPDAADGIPVAFTANINPGSDADPAAPDTRTVLTPTDKGGFTVKWKGKDQGFGHDYIYIWIDQRNQLKGETTGYSYVPTASEASSVLEPEDDQNKLTLPSAGEWNFTAIYGISSTYIGTAPASISPLTQSAPGKTEHIAAKDFSVATAAETVAANSEMPANISFKFEHKLSALQLQVKNGTGEALTVNEIRLSVTGEKITTKKYYGVTAKGWITHNDEQESDYLQLKIQTPAALASNAADPQKFHMLLFPEPAHGGKDMTVTVITNRGEFALTKPAPKGGFIAGKNYLTDITIKTNPSTGSGETWTEYITSKADLIAFRERVNSTNNYYKKTVRLTADIDLGNDSWTPIGNSPKNFQGTFDGGGHHISGLNVNIGTDYAGLFGLIGGGTVRNLRVSGNVTTTGNKAGGIVGQPNSSTVENCIFSGTVKGNKYVGGIAGYSSNSSRITGSYTKDKVTATLNTVGGIVGWNNTGCVIESCYSEAEVKSVNSLAGGIAGDNGGTISHCYATGAISGTTNVGGIAGNNSGGTVTGCIALNPSLTRTKDAAVTFGQIAGNTAGTVTDCAAFDGMKFTDGTSDITNRTGADGTGISASTCLTKAAYITDCGFTEATATTPGWAFDTATPWTYLPWNKAFESFPGITKAEDYRIKVPVHLGGSGTN